MKFPKNELIAERLLSETGDLQYVITKSLTDPPKFTLYKIQGEEKIKLQTSKSPLELQAVWKEAKPEPKRKESL